MEPSRKRLHSISSISSNFIGAPSSFEFLGGGHVAKAAENIAVESIINHIQLNLINFENSQKIRVFDDLIMRIVSMKIDTLTGSTLSATQKPPQFALTPAPKSPPRPSQNVEQQFADFQANLLRQQLYQNVQYLPQYNAYQRVAADAAKSSIDPLIKFQQLMRESAAAETQATPPAIPQPRMMAPPRIAPTPIPAPPVLLPQVTNKKIFPKVRACNQWSVVSLPLPLAG